jgi:hypothetical protein
MTGACCRAALTLLMVAFAAPILGAQLSRAGEQRSAAACPVVGGVTVSVTARDTGSATPRDLVRVDRTTSVDTTFRFDVAERRWALAEMAASVAVGLADTVRGKWYLCAGAGVGLTRPTLVVHGARGQIRLRASLAELSRVLGSRTPQSDPTRTPPRRS